MKYFENQIKFKIKVYTNYKVYTYRTMEKKKYAKRIGGIIT